ncbi:MAG TPA: hypothetical protein VGJ78_02450, partial [Vicinamibacterales bacterium]
MRTRVGGVKLVVVASVAALALVGLALRSFGVAEANGVASPLVEILAFVVGVWLPLFALIYACVRNRVAVVVLAFCVGLSVNLVFLTHAMPAAAVTDNSSVFTFKRTTAYVPGNVDMQQNYTPSGASTTCVTAGTLCTYFSDQFTTGQTLSAGTAQTDLYLSNNIPAIAFRGGGVTWLDSNVCVAPWPQGTVVKGDVFIAACAFRGGSGVAITPPDASWTALTRIDNGTTISLATFYHVVATSYEFSATGNVQFAPGSSQKSAGGLFSYSGVDNANPVDVENGQATASGTSHTALGVTTTAANALLITWHAVAGSTGNINQWTPPAAMSERAEGSINTGSNGTNAGLEGAELLLGAPGAIGDQTATSVFSGLGATKTIALRPATTCTVTATLKKVNPIW